MSNLFFIQAVQMLGGTIATAKLLGVSKSAVAQFKSGYRRLPVARALEVERLTGGRVTHQQMRPDLPWITDEK